MRFGFKHCESKISEHSIEVVLVAPTYRMVNVSHLTGFTTIYNFEYLHTVRIIYIVRRLEKIEKPTFHVMNIDVLFSRMLSVSLFLRMLSLRSRLKNKNPSITERIIRNSINPHV